MTTPELTRRTLLEVAEKTRDTWPVRASSTQSWWGCPRKFFYLYRARIRRQRVEVSKALEIGTIYHLIWEHYGTNGFDLPAAIKATTKDVESRAESFAKRLDGLEHEDALVASPQIVAAIEAMKASLPVAIAMASIFVETYPPSYGPDDVVGTELDLTGTFPGGREIGGRIDWLIRRGGKLWPKDHKTTSYPVTLAALGFRYRFQSYIYTLLVNQNFSQPLGGMIYDVMQKPTIRFCGKDKGLVENYVARVRTWYEENRVQAISSQFLPPLPDEETGDVGNGISMAITAGSLPVDETLQYFPRQQASCLSWRRPCPFASLCNSSPATWNGILPEEYEWIPGEEDETPEEGKEE